MQIGRWYDPIARRWHEPDVFGQKLRAMFVETPVPETDTEKGYRLARERAIWEAVEATAQATQQESNP